MALRLKSLLISLFSAISVAYCLENENEWPDFVEDGRSNFPKPTSWQDKNYGQWCRNRTLGLYHQCQMGSAVHLYECCGVNGTECCFRLQPVVLAYGGGLGIVCLISLIFGLLLKYNIICPVTPDRQDIEYQDIPKSAT